MPQAKRTIKRWKANELDQSKYIDGDRLHDLFAEEYSKFLVEDG